VLELWWDASTAPRGDIDGWLRENAMAAVDAAGATAPVRTLVGRSLGTGALAELRGERDLAELPTIWLAPLLRSEPVRSALLDAGAPCLVIGGSADPAFDAEFATSLDPERATVVILEGAHHGLAVVDPFASVALLRTLLEALESFVDRHLGH
jgi:pimeloyl-ACP methyl ester carboxylesterase